MLCFCDDTDVEYIHTTTFSNFSYFIKPSFVLKLNTQIIDVISIQYSKIGNLFFVLNIFRSTITKTRRAYYKLVKK